MAAQPAAPARALIDAPTQGAKMDDGILRIQFEAPAKPDKRGGRR